MKQKNLVVLMILTVLSAVFALSMQGCGKTTAADDTSSSGFLPRIAI